VDETNEALTPPGLSTFGRIDVTPCHAIANLRTGVVTTVLIFALILDVTISTTEAFDCSRAVILG
jgi:hypothetical protein